MELISVLTSKQDFGDLRRNSLHTILPYTGEFTLVIYNTQSKKYDINFARGKNGDTRVSFLKPDGDINEWNLRARQATMSFLQWKLDTKPLPADTQNISKKSKRRCRW